MLRVFKDMGPSPGVNWRAFSGWRFWSPRFISRFLGVSPQTPLGPARHAEPVLAGLRPSGLAPGPLSRWKTSGQRRRFPESPLFLPGDLLASYLLVSLVRRCGWRPHSPDRPADSARDPVGPYHVSIVSAVGKQAPETGCKPPP